MNKVRISAEIENIKKYQRETIELKNTITELKNSIENHQFTKKENKSGRQQQRNYKTDKNQ